MSFNVQTNKNQSTHSELNKSPITRKTKIKKVKGTPKSLAEIHHSPSKQIRSDSLCFLREKFYSLFSKIQNLKRKDDVIGQGQQFKNTIKQFTISDLCFKAYRSSDKAAIQQYVRSKIQPQNYTQQTSELQVNTTQELSNKQKLECSLVQAYVKRSKYNKRLEPLKASKMSNNIKDYLSVQRISVKDIEDGISKPKIQQRYHICNISQSKPLIQKSKHSKITQINLSPKSKPYVTTQFFKKFVKFNLPFQTYYYRDFIWKVAYSNNNVMKIPEEYKQKVKCFIGCGNNSNLIKGIMRRRSWFQIVDKVQDAQFIWTQIKIPTIFHQQTKCEEHQHISEEQLEKQHKQQEKITNQCQRKYTIFNRIQKQKWKKYWQKNIIIENRCKQQMMMRNKVWKIQQKQQNIAKIKIHNHFENNFILGNKKNLFKIMSEYYTLKCIDPFQKLPLTFHITNGLEDQKYQQFLQIYHSIQKNRKNNNNQHNAWIVKPGENSNRGNGIKICLDLSEIKSILKMKDNHKDGSVKTYIVQKYIQNPLLYKKRKFDIRHYMLLNCSNGVMKGYWYRHGYVRTTSSQYSLKNNGQGVHLTNDAVQKYLPDYGRYQKSNKLTYEELDAFINKQDTSFNFYKQIYPKMKALATDAIRASALNMDPMRRVNNFEVFGMDFMIDEAYNVWLIEINTNPCLQTNCPILYQIIPALIQNTFKICLDPIFPPPINFKPKSEVFLNNTNDQNNYQLIFDQRIDTSNELKEGVVNIGQNQQDTFDDEGQDFNQQY